MNTKILGIAIAASVSSLMAEVGPATSSCAIDNKQIHIIDGCSCVRVNPEWYTKTTEGVVAIDGSHFASVTNETDIVWQP